MGILPRASIFAFLFLATRVIHAQQQQQQQEQQADEDADRCYANEEDPYVLFSTKTSYLEVDNENVDPVILPGCEAKSFWLVARHGTRNPGKKAIKKIKKHVPRLRDKIVENFENGKGSLCEIDVEGFREWGFNLTAAEASLLTESGREEQRLLGKRFRQRLPGLLDQPFDKEKYKFRHTIKMRAEESAKAYAETAFPGEDVFMPDPLKDDPLLRFYDFCTKWVDETDENDSTYEEQRLFGESEFMLRVIKSVSERLGFDNDTLSLEDITNLYDVCRYERAWNPDETSSFCAPFEEEDLKVLEFYEDLEYWSKNGYANELNYKMSCPLVKDMVDIFSMNETERPLGTFYFSHSEALLPFLAILGLYKDPPGTLNHTGYASSVDREYRTSLIASFSTSVAFVLFECDEEMKIMALHKETPVKLDKCRDRVCGWQEFQAAYREDIECHFDRLCGLEASKSRAAAAGNEAEAESEPENNAAANGVTYHLYAISAIIMITYNLIPLY